MVLTEIPERCNQVIQWLEEGDQVSKLAVVIWFHKVTRQLALSKLGCRVVQKALEVTGGPDRDLIITELKDHIVELYESPHGNHVLSKAVEVLPAAHHSFVISGLLGQGVAVSKHRYGCRVMCRLIEHNSEEQIGALLDESLAEADMLARHQYGTFVVQTALEHTARRSAILSQLLPGFPSLVMHRTGSLVSQRVLDYCSPVDQMKALRVMLDAEGENSIVEASCNHYGSYVLAQVANLRQKHPGHSEAEVEFRVNPAQEIERVLASNLQHLMSPGNEQHAQRVAMAFGLVPAEQL
jgi:mRNA-binding protein PUF3